jgi:multiple sugar transport system substrate-binding protein
MSKKGKIAPLLIGALTAQLLAACGGGAKDDATPAVGNNPAEEKRNPVELVVYFPYIADWSEEQFMEAFGDPLKKKYPHITLKYIGGGPPGTKIPEVLAAGINIDIVYASIGATPPHLLDVALEYDISGLIKQFNFDLSKLEPAMVDMIRKLGNGKIYGLPVYVPPSAVYYNKDIFDKFGVPYPKDGYTWDDMYDMNLKLTREDNGVQYVGIGASYGHMTQLNQLSLPLVNENATQAVYGNDARWAQWIENFVRFYRVPGYEKYNAKLSEPNERNRFFKDRVVGMFMALTALHQPTEVNDLNWDLTTYPTFKERPGVGPQPYPTYFYITNISKHKEDAFMAISFFASDEFQMERSKEGRFLTTSANRAIRDVFGQDNPFYKGKNVKAFQPQKYADPPKIHKFNVRAGNDIGTAMAEVIRGQKDINTALRDAMEKTNKYIQEELAKEAANK